uniref:Uncharacterized protein n=1 Tax=Romanomermis culicivorax TaxID=13658 RepID=A0A915L1G6_ROMCU
MQGSKTSKKLCYDDPHKQIKVENNTSLVFRPTKMTIDYATWSKQGQIWKNCALMTQWSPKWKTPDYNMT